MLHVQHWSPGSCAPVLDPTATVGSNSVLSTTPLPMTEAHWIFFKAQPTHPWLCSKNNYRRGCVLVLQRFQCSCVSRTPEVVDKPKLRGRAQGTVEARESQETDCPIRSIRCKLMNKVSKDFVSAGCPDGPKPHCHESDSGAQDPVRQCWIQQQLLDPTPS